MPRLQTIAFLLLGLMGSGLFGGCASYEDQRIRQLMVEKGFGTLADGRASIENYVASGDAVQFLVPADVQGVPEAAQLVILAQPQQVGIDGTILIPYAGPVHVLGLTEAELSAQINSILQPLFNVAIDVQARIINRGKAFYAFGEVLQKGRIPMVKGDLTVMEVMSSLGWTQLANLGRINVIYPDAQNPQVVEVNFYEMALTGNTTWNLPVYNNTFIYVPPTIIGGIARFIQRALAPLQSVVQTIVGAAVAVNAYDVITGDAQFVNGGRRF